jgi:DNA helicase IV
MRCLKDVVATPEQLSIVSRNKPGIEVIRGAAGSGKTTTALLRLRSLLGVFLNRRKRASSPEPVKVLVLTYNKTLRGYIKELVDHQVPKTDEIELSISTFGKWAYDLIGSPKILNDSYRAERVGRLGASTGLPVDFLVDEVDYILGRFPHDALDNYLTAKRDGRGITPKVDKKLREIILSDVVVPYKNQLSSDGLLDWHDVAAIVGGRVSSCEYDIIVCDEAQDFSANQIRAVLAHSREISSLTFVVDTAQRIYARGFSWIETGISVRPENSFRLSRNYRNTKQIAAFASPLVFDLPADDDFTPPDFNSASAEGSKPVVLQGKFNQQAEFAIKFILSSIDLKQHSVAFLHPKGGGCFNFLKQKLDENGLRYVDLTRQEDWPAGEENIALCTLHSAKGLEFDHVFMIGLNNEFFPEWEDESDHRLINVRKLLSVGIGRAKLTVTLGAKAEDWPKVFNLLVKNTYDLRVL